MVGYLILLISTIGVFALFSLGLNLHWGFTGLLNFGHVAFLLVGAYSTALLSLQGVPLLGAALIGTTLAALLGLVIGLCTLRLREDYLGIVTIGISEVLRILTLNQQGLTGGSFGVQGYPIPLATAEPIVLVRLFMAAGLGAIALWGGKHLWGWLRLGRRQVGRWAIALMAAAVGLLTLLAMVQGVFYLEEYPRAGQVWWLLLVLAGVLAGVNRLIHSPWGRVLQAIREDETVAQALGKNVLAYKLQSLVLGGAIAGLAGAFYAWQLTAIYPDNFKPQLTFDAWTLIVLGGTAHSFGPLLGSVLFWAYDSLTRFVLPVLLPLDGPKLSAIRIMLIGLLLMALMIWRPQGILGQSQELTLDR
jgi:neutral amino acid transport system permease protein